MGLYNHLVFFPWKYPIGYYDDPTARGQVARDVWFHTSSGVTLHGWYFEKEKAKRTVIVHHGQGGNVSLGQYWAALFLDCQANVLLYDYEGYGRSEGEPTMEALQQNGLAAIDFIHEVKKIPYQQIVNCGQSLGTGVAAYATTMRPTAGLILFSPYASLIECGQQRIPILSAYPRFMWPKNELECRTCVKGTHPPVLIIHGTEDWVIPISNADELYRIATQPTNYIRLKNAYHAPLNWNFSPTINSFLNRL
jgi:uncharacterized protein